MCCCGEPWIVIVGRKKSGIIVAFFPAKTARVPNPIRFDLVTNLPHRLGGRGWTVPAPVASEVITQIQEQTKGTQDTETADSKGGGAAGREGFTMGDRRDLSSPE